MSDPTKDDVLEVLADALILMIIDLMRKVGKSVDKQGAEYILKNIAVHLVKKHE